LGLNVHALMIGYIDQDGTERPVQRPQDAEQQKEHYSGKTDIPANTQQVAHHSRLLIVPTAHDPDPVIADMPSVGLLRLCSVLVLITCVISSLIFISIPKPSLTPLNFCPVLSHNL
jgi:hypothetical protein